MSNEYWVKTVSSWLWMVALIAAAWAVGCSADPGGPETDSETHWALDFHLPDLAGGSDSDCTPPPPEDAKLTIEEWVGAGDGVVIGDVVEVQPSLDPLYAVNGPDRSTLVSDATCEDDIGGTISGGFSVQLENIEGYLHDEELPEEMTLHFGYGLFDAFHYDQAPEIDASGVTWPQDAGIGPGMRLGGLVFEEAHETGRWSFRPNKEYMRPLFQVVDDEIQHQKSPRGDAMCAPKPPLDEIEDLGEAQLLGELDALDNADELFNAPEDRMWAVHNNSYIEDDDRVLPRPKDWVGYCWYFSDDESEADCQLDADCQADETCSAGECVECMTDVDCAPGICNEGLCVGDD